MIFYILFTPSFFLLLFHSKRVGESRSLLFWFEIYLEKKIAKEGFSSELKKKFSEIDLISCKRFHTKSGLCNTTPYQATLFKKYSLTNYNLPKYALPKYGPFIMYIMNVLDRPTFLNFHDPSWTPMTRTFHGRCGAFLVLKRWIDWAKRVYLYLVVSMNLKGY